MSNTYPLFLNVALTEDIPEKGLKRGDIATVVEHYVQPEGQEDGYSLEGFRSSGITIEVSASQITSVSQ
ncbi:MAG: DUF4926 domain-containing protein [Cyanobacteria bacterium J06627_28]